MDIFKSNIVVGLTAGLAATVLAPVVIPVVAMAARPLAKSMLKGGVILYEKGREALALAGEEMEDLIAEVRAEMEMEQAGYGHAAEPAAAAGEGEGVGEGAAQRGQDDFEAGMPPDGAARRAGNGAQA